MKIAVIGQGYVGLPLAMALSLHYETVGYDISKERIQRCQQGKDPSGELDQNDFEQFRGTFSHELADIQGCDVYIVTVPTPIDDGNHPDLTMLSSACSDIASVMKRGSIVIFESTVYPGCTEEICIPILSRESGMQLNVDFGVGYSPERVSPGIGGKRLTEIVKVVSASSELSLKVVKQIYEKIIDAGTFSAPSIKAAEAAKIIENTQRDINIALMNEFSLILRNIGIHWSDVLPAAFTKWNFAKFYPGLVGGHCIGVDPYYLAYKANKVGVIPELITAGRKINESMAKEHALEICRRLGRSLFDHEFLIAGVTFKPNCSDLRNTKVEDLAFELLQLGCHVTVFDPNSSGVSTEKHDLPIVREAPAFDKKINVILAVEHNELIAEFKKTCGGSYFGNKVNKFFILQSFNDINLKSNVELL